VAETRDPSSPEKRAGSSGIPLHNDAVAADKRSALRPSEVPLTCLTEGTEGIAVRDRELRVFCRRLLGSSEVRSVQVDDAVDGVIAAVARGLPIALRGTSDLVPVAYALHRRILGADRPFVVCDPAGTKARARCARRRTDGPWHWLSRPRSRPDRRDAGGITACRSAGTLAVSNLTDAIATSTHPAQLQGSAAGDRGSCILAVS
jgi:hypothetical protein